MATTQTPTRRVVRHGNHMVTQVRQSDGSWWNIDVRPVTDVRS